MKAAKSTFVAYLDILGARYWSHVDPDYYRRTLRGFQRTVLDQAYQLQGSGIDSELFSFNDCAYIQSTSLDKLVGFLQSVRQELSPSQTYIKGALAIGTLSSMELSVTAGRQLGKGVHAELLDGDAIAVYSLADHLKGIGIWVDDVLAKSREMKGRVVKSCFVDTVPAGTLKCFHDLRYADGETNPARLGSALSECLRINAEEPAGGRYFVTYVTSLIRSLPWDGSSPESNHFDAVLGMVTHKDFWSSFADLPGVDAVLGTLLDEAVETAGTQTKVTKGMFERFSRFRRIHRRVTALPHCLLSRNAKAQFLHHLGERFEGKPSDNPNSYEP